MAGLVGGVLSGLGSLLGLDWLVGPVKVPKKATIKATALKAFVECDEDSNGRLDMKETHIGVLVLYDKINAKQASHLHAPPSAVIKEQFARHDADGRHALSQDQFVDLASELLAKEKHWWDNTLLRGVLRVAVHVALFPLAGSWLRVLAMRNSVSIFKKVAPGLWGIGAEAIYRAARMVLPWLP